MGKVGNLIIRKRESGKYEYKFEVDPIDGRRQWISKGGFARKKEAVAEGNRIRDEYIRTNGKPLRKQDNISVNTLADLYLERILINKEPTTYVSYENLISAHIRPKLGKLAVKDLDYYIIEKFLQELVAKELRYSTVNSIKVVITKMMAFAVNPIGVIQINPASGVELPAMDQEDAESDEKTPYTTDQIWQILDYIDHESCYRLPVILGIFCGLRIGEALGLTWDCVDLEAGTITVKSQIIDMRYDHKFFQIYKKPKKKKSYRTIHISSFVQKELMIAKKNQQENQQILGAYYQHPQTYEFFIGKKKVQRLINESVVTVGNQELFLVCRKKNGAYIQYSATKKFLKNLSNKLGYDIQTHIGRHTHATLAVENGASLPALSARLGHSSAQSTLNYTHLTNALDLDTMKRFEKGVSTK